MSFKDDHHHQQQILRLARRTTIFRWPSRKTSTSKARTKRRKLPWVRLGGKRPRSGFSIIRIFRRLKLQWLRLKYSQMLKKLKTFYSSIVKDLLEASATLDSIQQVIMMDTYFTVPVMAMSVASIPSHMHRRALM